jgi:hypothetical protein
MVGKDGGKAKPLKAAKKGEKEYDEARACEREEEMQLRTRAGRRRRGTVRRAQRR